MIPGSCVRSHTLAAQTGTLPASSNVSLVVLKNVGPPSHVGLGHGLRRAHRDRLSSCDQRSSSGNLARPLGGRSPAQGFVNHSRGGPQGSDVSQHRRLPHGRSTNEFSGQGASGVVELDQLLIPSASGLASLRRNRLDGVLVRPRSRRTGACHRPAFGHHEQDRRICMLLGALLIAIGVYSLVAIDAHANDAIAGFGILFGLLLLLSNSPSGRRRQLRAMIKELRRSPITGRSSPLPRWASGGNSVQRLTPSWSHADVVDDEWG